MGKSWNAINWTPETIDFIKRNHSKMTNQELANHLGLKVTSVRTKCYSLGLFKMKLEYWNEEQIAFLKENYKTKGDTELAEIFNLNWEKEKGWSKKHIEKKRRYLGLKRTQKEKESIRKNHQSNGVYKIGNQKMWQTRGVSKIGTIKIWSGEKFIKTEKGFIHLRVYNYKKYFGNIPKGMLVCHKDDNKLNCNPNNLILLTREENAIKSHTNGLLIEHLQTHTLISRINRKIKQIQRNNGKK